MVRLRRGLSARLRPLGYAQILMWMALIATVASAPIVFTSSVYTHRDRILLALAISALLVPRVALATGSVVATSSGLRWRSLFMSREYLWSELGPLTVARIQMLRNVDVTGLRVYGDRFVGGYADIHASFQCRDDALAEFVAWANVLRSVTEGEACDHEGT
jgi:hypothetical protein